MEVKITPNLSWLRVGEIIDEGCRTAVYPYSKLRNISNRDDVRGAVLEETESLEDEFGRALIEPFYRLIWTLNSGKGVCTSHSVVSSPAHKSRFDWARHCVGAQLTLLSREPSDRLHRPVAYEMVKELYRTLLQSPFLKAQNLTGWLVIIRPTNVNFWEEKLAVGTSGQMRMQECKWRGYGCDLIVSGSASSRRKAGERWSRCAAFIADTLYELQVRNCALPALPYKHY